MTHLARVAPACLFVGSITTLAATATSQEKDPAVAIRKIREAVTETLKSTPGVMLAVVRDGKVLLAHTEGRVGKDKTARQDRKADAATLFPLGGSSRAIANLALARLHESKQIDGGAKATDVLPWLSLPTAEGAPKDPSILDILRGKPGMPIHQNFLQREDLGRWPSRRAIDENARAKDWPYSGNLAYAILQHALEASTRSSWASLVDNAVAKPLGMQRLVPDARAGLPTSRTELHREGLFGLSMLEKTWYSNFAAAHGAWLDAADLSKLLLELLRAAGDASSLADLRTLTETRIEFANYAATSLHREAHYLHMRHDMPGMHGGITLCPGQDVAWGVFANASYPQSSGIPKKIRAALQRTLLPARPSGNPWNSAVGLGGGAGGAFNKSFASEQLGEWVADLKLHGAREPLRIWVDRRGIRTMQFGDRPKTRMRSFHYGERVTLNGGDVLRLRSDTNLKTEVVLLERDGRRSFEGTLTVRGDYCWMQFVVAFRKVESPREKKKQP